jgi:hypothetical protein
VLYAKRLEQGAFQWPKITDGVMRMTVLLAALAREHRHVGVVCGSILRRHIVVQVRVRVIRKAVLTGVSEHL